MRSLLAVVMTVAACAQGLAAQPAGAPSQAAVADVDQRALARDLAKRLESDFVYPEQAARYAETLRANADRGAYDALAGAELAKRLSDDLQSVAEDGHLRVMFEGIGGGPQIVIRRAPDAAGSAPTGQTTGQPVMMRMPRPPAIEHAGWIAPGIAFVRFNGFPGGDEATEAARAFMATHADAKAIIFDLRMHRGGGLDEMDAVFPWLFAEPTHLVTMATRKSVDEAGGSPIAGVASLRTVSDDPAFVTREHWVVPGPDQRLAQTQVFVLTSGFSASAAEHFVLALKQTKRATVIGGTTAGANHFGGDQDLGGGFTAFIPVGRTSDPKTGKDWEGTGIAPDIETAPENALTNALTLLDIPEAEAARLSARVAPQMPMIRRQ
ncbi:S41 family peptidase [Blastomonas fulva]|uniref:S41 family peptidase n=1 Tax=Blastomonas fulva TaxID=1550728 RepID=UPI003F719FB0